MVGARVVLEIVLLVGLAVIVRSLINEVVSLRKTLNSVSFLADRSAETTLRLTDELKTKDKEISKLTKDNVDCYKAIDDLIEYKATVQVQKFIKSTTFKGMQKLKNAFSLKTK